MSQEVDEETTAKYIACVFAVIILAAFGGGWTFFQEADWTNEQWQSDPDMSSEQQWNLFNTALTLRSFGFTLTISGIAFLGTGMAFYLQSRPKRSDKILTDGFQMLARAMVDVKMELEQLRSDLSR